MTAGLRLTSTRSCVMLLLLAAENRRLHVQRKAKHEMKQCRGETDPSKIEFYVALAETQLDNVMMQRRLLNQLAEEGNLKGPR